jgi:hypothetical protein
MVNLGVAVVEVKSHRRENEKEAKHHQPNFICFIFLPIYLYQAQRVHSAELQTVRASHNQVGGFEKGHQVDVAPIAF